MNDILVSKVIKTEDRAVQPKCNVVHPNMIKCDVIDPLKRVFSTAKVAQNLRSAKMRTNIWLECRRVSIIRKL